MKITAIILLFFIGIVSLYTWRFPLWFNYVLSDSLYVSEVIDKLGDPDKVTESNDFPEAIADSVQSHGASKVYYWSNGSNSYHYVVTKDDGEIIDYSSQSW